MKFLYVADSSKSEEMRVKAVENNPMILKIALDGC